MNLCTISGLHEPKGNYILQLTTSTTEVFRIFKLAQNSYCQCYVNVIGAFKLPSFIVFREGKVMIFKIQSLYLKTVQYIHQTNKHCIASLTTHKHHLGIISEEDNSGSFLQVVWAQGVGARAQHLRWRSVRDLFLPVQWGNGHRRVSRGWMLLGTLGTLNLPMSRQKFEYERSH